MSKAFNLSDHPNVVAIQRKLEKDSVKTGMSALVLQLKRQGREQEANQEDYCTRQTVISGLNLAIRKLSAVVESPAEVELLISNELLKIRADCKND